MDEKYWKDQIDYLVKDRDSRCKSLNDEWQERYTELKREGLWHKWLGIGMAFFWMVTAFYLKWHYTSMP